MGFDICGMVVLILQELSISIRNKLGVYIVYLPAYP
jgi:hypothetical protein